jgi:hypothetical protein
MQQCSTFKGSRGTRTRCRKGFWSCNQPQQCTRQSLVPREQTAIDIWRLGSLKELCTAGLADSQLHELEYQVFDRVSVQALAERAPPWYRDAGGDSNICRTVCAV